MMRRYTTRLIPSHDPYRSIDSTVHAVATARSACPRGVEGLLLDDPAVAHGSGRGRSSGTRSAGARGGRHVHAAPLADYGTAAARGAALCRVAGLSLRRPD